jgi:hypothetical protein
MTNNYENCQCEDGRSQRSSPFFQKFPPNWHFEKKIHIDNDKKYNNNNNKIIIYLFWNFCSHESAMNLETWLNIICFFCHVMISCRILTHTHLLALLCNSKLPPHALLWTNEQF